MAGAYDVQIPAVGQAIRSFANRIQSKLDEPDRIDTQLSVPYFTGTVVDGQEIWAASFDFGTLPNRTIKLLMIPTDILNTWGLPRNRWVDVQRSYAHNATSGVTIPLPHTSLFGGEVDLPAWSASDVYVESNQVTLGGFVYEANQYTQGDDPETNSAAGGIWTNLGSVEEVDVPRRGQDAAVINIYLDGDTLAVETSSDRSDYDATVSIMYLRST